MTSSEHKEREPGDLPPELAGLLLDLASEAIFLLDSGMGIVGVNEQACTLLAYSKRELVGLALHGLIPSEYHDGMVACTETMARGEASRGQHEMFRKDGSTVMVEFSARRLADGHVLGIVRDVSERARAEAELRRHKEFVERLLESSADGIVAFDTNMVVTLFNPAIERITGVEAKDVLGRKAFEVFPFLRDVNEDELMGKALRGETTAARDKTFTIPRTGRVGRYESRYSPLTDESGNVAGAIGVIRDVTERHELEQRLLHAQKLETAGRLAGGIAHDFNNVLTVILGEVALGLGPRSSEEKAREALRRIGESAERAASITRQLLAFSRRQFASPSVFTLDELMDGITPMLGHLVGEGISLSIVRAGTATVRADRGHLEQVLANLIVNARDAMPDGGLLTIEAHEQHLEPSSEWRLGSVASGDYAVLSVTDTGVGMDDEVQSRLLEPFFTTKPNGTGLGLCSCIGLLQTNGGDLAVESAAGKGTTVRVCLPQVSPQARSGSSAGSHAAAPKDVQARGVERILLVEDEEAVRSVTAKMLRALGYSVHEAENGVAALAFLESGRMTIDLVLSDVVMPRMGGGELMERIRSRFPGMRVLLMTGYMDDNALRRRVESEGLPILEKPFTESALAAKVRAVLDGSAG